MTKATLGKYAHPHTDRVNLCCMATWAAQTHARAPLTVAVPAGNWQFRDLSGSKQATDLEYDYYAGTYASDEIDEY